MVFVLIPGTVLKILRISKDEENEGKWVFCYVNVVAIGPTGGGAGGQGNRTLRGLELSSCTPTPLTTPHTAHTPHLRGGEGLEVESITDGQWFYPFCLCNEASIKTPEERF